MQSFARRDRLPPDVFAIVDELKMQTRWAGEDIFALDENEHQTRQALDGRRLF
ncbi:MAG: hypothetical protein O7G88_01770 [bacterium]|nr:hypothetical protein [bacterium]